MEHKNWKKKKGFGVFLESGDWRIAYHAFEEQTNGESSIKKWGIHQDSGETFTLLEGEACLAVKDENGDVQLQRISRNDVYFVEAGERHILVLSEGTKVIITENKDMKNTVTEPVTEEDIKTIKTFLKGERI